jgi:hypothetical protein
MCGRCADGFSVLRFWSLFSGPQPFSSNTKNALGSKETKAPFDTELLIPGSCLGEGYD